MVAGASGSPQENSVNNSFHLSSESQATQNKPADRVRQCPVLSLSSLFVIFPHYLLHYLGVLHNSFKALKLHAKVIKVLYNELYKECYTMNYHTMNV